VTSINNRPGSRIEAETVPCPVVAHAVQPVEVHIRVIPAQPVLAAGCVSKNISSLLKLDSDCRSASVQGVPFDQRVHAIQFRPVGQVRKAQGVIAELPCGPPVRCASDRNEPSTLPSMTAVK